jgi:CubicO group peptidase (beta-lactamase class C family)
VSPPTPTFVLDAAAERLQSALEQWTRTTGLSSVMVALRVNGQTWKGSARADGQPGPDPDTRYRVMSITKTVTAALVLRDAEAGLIDLDAPLPPIEGVAAPVPEGVTVRRLLAHRSGLTEYTEAPGYRADQPVSAEQAVEGSLRAPLLSVPGTVTKYVNANYLLLGLLLQQIHQRPFADLVTGITSPLGISASRVEPSDRLGWPGFSSGGIVGTVADMAVWGDALFSRGRVLGPSALDWMTTTGDFHGGLGVWGVCPCSGTDPALTRYVAIGHSTAAGAMYRFPASGITLTMKAEPEGGDTVARAVALHGVLLTALRG